MSDNAELVAITRAPSNAGYLEKRHMVRITFLLDAGKPAYVYSS
jgi:hypothetical protein